MKFKSKKDTYFKVLVIGTISLLFIGNSAYGLTYSEFKSSDFLKFLPLLAFTLFIVVSKFKTIYKIEENVFTYRSLFHKDSIPIDRIHSIAYHNKYFFGSHPATAMSGLLIRHSTNQKVYITPENKEVFIKMLLKINNDIEIRSQLKKVV